MKKILFILVIFSVLFLSACNKQSTTNIQSSEEWATCSLNDPEPTCSTDTVLDNSNFKITTTAFQSGWKIPGTYSCMWKNINPDLEISWAPKWTQSFALIVHDPDASKWDRIHRMLRNIPAWSTKIEQWNTPAWSTIWENSRWKAEYRWPCPPSWTHRYYFKLYSLDTNYWDLPSQMTLEEFENITKPHILWTTEIMWTYSSVK